MDGMRIDRCETCRWFEARGQEANAGGTCHFNPPVPFPVMVKTLQGDQTVYGGVQPATTAYGFCGQFKRVDFNS